MKIARIMLASACLALFQAAGAQDQAPTPLAFEIERQPLADALSAFARQAGLQVIQRDENVSTEGFVAPRVVGKVTAREALEQLLANTGLKYEFINERTVRISKAGADSVSSSQDRAVAGAVRVAQVEEKQGVADSAEESEGAKLEEIVVTAQKRKERLQDVPISMSVLSGDDLDKSTVQGVTEALSRVPGVATSLALQGGGTQISVRGVSAGGPVFEGSSPIAYYLDSVPFGLTKTAIAPDASAYDLERVEVLRGPQGTLYGASAQNGVVRVLTKDANLNDVELKARTSISNTRDGGENYRADAALNVPLVPGKLAARAVVGYENLGGWVDKPNRRDANDAELRNFRLKINAQPTDALSIGLSAWQSRDDFGAQSFANENRQVSSTADESFSTDYDAYGLRVDYDFPAFSLASMTSYLDYANEGQIDLLPLYGVSYLLFTGIDSKVLSQEVVLNSNHAGPWRWGFGGIYRDAEDRLIQPGTNYSDRSESFAFFGQLTRAFFDDRLELTGALRYFEDKGTQTEHQPPDIPPVSPLIRNSSTFDATSPRVVLTWHPNVNSTIYGSYSEGFRSGFNQNAGVIRIAPNIGPLEADTLKNYELGTKGAFLEGRISYDAAVYYIDWQDVQQSLGVLDPVSGVPITAMVNGQSASGAGVEFAVTTQPVRGLELGVSFGWSDLKMDSEVNSIVSDSFELVLFNKGDRLNYSPEYTAGASVDYVLPLGGAGYKGRVSASANYASRQTYRSVAGILFIDVGDPMLMSRASLSIDSPSRWTATVFADNINNESSPGIGLYNVSDWPARVRPRTIGLQFEYRY